MKIRVDNLPKVCKGQAFYQYEDTYIWTDEFCNWLDNNAAEQIAQIHSLKDPQSFNQIIILEFKSAEDATIFSLQFC